MANWLILKRNEQKRGASAWEVVNLIRDKTADAAGAAEALQEAQTGPGKYGVLRADNGRTVTIKAVPETTEDPSPEF
jgi:hypothetical protein